MTSAAIYVRVSQDAKGTARSVTEQEADCRKVCERNGWDVIGVWCDNDIGASRHAKKKRPQWIALTERLDIGDVDVLVCWEISRTTRDRLAWAGLAEQCITTDTLICVDGKEHDLSDPDAAFNLDLQALLGVREAGVTRKRVLRAVAANADSGRPHGKIPYGYRREYDPHTKALVGQVPDDDKADVVRDIVARVAAGETLYSICKDFNGRDLRTPRGGPDVKWVPSTVRRIATNPAYVAKRVHQGEIVGDADWPALVDETQFWKARARMADPSRRRKRETRLRYLLSGVAVCGECGGEIRVINNRGMMSYCCKGEFCVSRKITNVDEFVARTMVHRLAKPDLADLFSDDGQDERIKARETLDQLNARLKGFYDEAIKGTLSPNGLATIEASLLSQIEAAEQLTRKVSVGAASPVAEFVGKTLEEAEALWVSLDVGAQRQIVRELAEVKIHKSYRGCRNFDPALVPVRFYDKLAPAS